MSQNCLGLKPGFIAFPIPRPKVRGNSWHPAEAIPISIIEAITTLFSDRERLQKIQQHNRTHAKAVYNPEIYKDTVKNIILDAV